MHEIKPFYLTSGRRKLFSLYTVPIQRSPKYASTAILFFPPLMDEMNKARPIIARQCKNFARLGIPVLQVDLFGTGDSEGSSEDVSLKIWRNNILDAVQWLKQDGNKNVIFWGLRAGCLLIFDLLHELSRYGDSMILWQPIFDGKLIYKQIKRQLAAKHLATHGNNTDLGVVKSEVIEVSGYIYSKRFYSEIESINSLDKSISLARKIFWANINSIESSKNNVLHTNLIENWQQEGVEVVYESLVGELFWMTPEIYIPESLLNATTSWFDL